LFQIRRSWLVNDQPGFLLVGGNAILTDYVAEKYNLPVHEKTLRTNVSAYDVILVIIIIVTSMLYR